MKKLQEIRKGIDHSSFSPLMDSFVKFAADKLGIENMPKIHYRNIDADKSFGGYTPSLHEITVTTKNRHPIDIWRTVCHEMIHHRQNEEGRIQDVHAAGETGSVIENEANAVAGQIMRLFAKENPDHFNLSYVSEGTSEDISEDISEELTEAQTPPGPMAAHKAVFVTGKNADRLIGRTLRGHGLIQVDHTLADENHRLALKNRAGLIIKTPDDPASVMRMKADLESNGYNTMMMYADHNKEAADEQSKLIHSQYKGMFNKNYLHVDDSDDHHRIFNKVSKFTKAAAVHPYDQPKPQPKTFNMTSPVQMGARLVPKAINESFRKRFREKSKDNPKNREEGTKKLVNNYQDATPGMPVGDNGIGPTVAVVPMQFVSMSENVVTWMSNPKIQARFKSKYGADADRKLYEAAVRLNETGK